MSICKKTSTGLAVATVLVFAGTASADESTDILKELQKSGEDVVQMSDAEKDGIKGQGWQMKLLKRFGNSLIDSAVYDGIKWAWNNHGGASMRYQRNPIRTGRGSTVY